MRTQTTYLLIGLLTNCFLGQCQTSNVIATPNNFDSIVSLLKNRSELTHEDILQLNVIDTSYSFASKETADCDTTIQLNKNIFYSIIHLPDTFAICSYYFVVTIDEKNRKAIASKYLMSDCDIDFGQDSYELYDYRIVSINTIELTATTVYQKKNRTSVDDEKNIKRKELKHNYFIIQPTGLIINSDKN